MCGEIDGQIAAFLDRPLDGDVDIWLDATYVKARRDGRIDSGRGDHRGRRQWRRQTRGAGPDDRRVRKGRDLFETAFLRKLARRGLRGVKLVISDAHEGTEGTGHRPRF